MWMRYNTLGVLAYFPVRVSLINDMSMYCGYKQHRININITLENREHNSHIICVPIHKF